MVVYEVMVAAWGAKSIMPQDRGQADKSDVQMSPACSKQQHVQRDRPCLAFGYGTTGWC